MKTLSEVTYSDMDILAEYMDDCLREYVEFRVSPVPRRSFSESISGWNRVSRTF